MKDLLTPIQRRFLEYLNADKTFRRYFYLTGGTALSAFHLFHRYSDDLDFFTHQSDLDIVPGLMKHAENKLNIKAKQSRKSPHFLRYDIENGLKIYFVADVSFRHGSPEIISDFLVDSVKNIAVNKVCAILGRLDSKDYVDLYLILKKYKYDIFELLELGAKKDAGLELFIWASVIADVQQLSILPKIIVPITLKEITDFYLELRDSILDKIKPV
ncbi:MAG: nucleotidyl transferase AbiEii/AbiGii toxin family protein [Pseudomonadota bacterium]